MLTTTFSSFSQALFSGTYHYQLPRDRSLFIQFHENNRFDLTMHEYSDGGSNIEVTIFSYGKYDYKDEKIILTDEANGFTMQLRLLSTGKIMIEKGFSFLKDKSFSREIYNNENDYLTTDITIEKQKQERNIYLKSHKRPYPVHYGIYESENNTFQDKEKNIHLTGLGYEIQLKKENKYTLHFKQILISEGIWNRNGNELSLFDETLQHSFYLLITDKGLISKYLPGEYSGCLLVYTNQ